MTIISDNFERRRRTLVVLRPEPLHSDQLEREQRFVFSLNRNGEEPTIKADVLTYMNGEFHHGLHCGEDYTDLIDFTAAAEAFAHKHGYTSLIVMSSPRMHLTDDVVDSLKQIADGA